MGENDKDGRKMETTYLKVKNGIIVVVSAKENNETQYAKNSTKLVLASYGLALMYKDYEIPIFEEMFEYVLKNRIISIYEVSTDVALQSPSATFEIERDMLVEGTTIYRYEKERAKTIPVNMLLIDDGHIL